MTDACRGSLRSIRRSFATHPPAFALWLRMTVIKSLPNPGLAGCEAYLTAVREDVDFDPCHRKYRSLNWPRQLRDDGEERFHP